MYLTDQADQLLVEILREYKEKTFRSAVDGDLELEDMPEEKSEDEYKEALDFVKEALGDGVDKVRVSRKLKTHPVCLTSGEGPSFEMERYFAAAQPEMGFKAQRILELNVEHPAFAALESARTADPEKAKKYAQVLFNQAKLIAGLPIDDPSGYTRGDVFFFLHSRLLYRMKWNAGPEGLNPARSAYHVLRDVSSGDMLRS